MQSLNSWSVVGNLTRDAKSTRISSGFVIVEFSIALDNRRKQNDEWVDETSYFAVKMFGKYAESLSPYLVKGQQVAVHGRGRLERWESQGGEERSRVVIEADNVQLVGKRVRNTENPGNEHTPDTDDYVPF